MITIRGPFQHWPPLHEGETEDDRLRSIAERLASDRRDRWQPIETAPRDGPILAVETSEHGADVPAVVEWRDGWRSYDDRSVVLQPTHWMPLPEPPQ